jgi:hypothetical protein
MGKFAELVVSRDHCTRLRPLLPDTGLRPGRWPRTNPLSRSGLWPPCNAAGTPPSLLQNAILAVQST